MLRGALKGLRHLRNAAPSESISNRMLRQAVREPYLLQYMESKPGVTSICSCHVAQSKHVTPWNDCLAFLVAAMVRPAAKVVAAQHRQQQHKQQRHKSKQLRHQLSEPALLAQPPLHPAADRNMAASWSGPPRSRPRRQLRKLQRRPSHNSAAPL